MPIRSELDLAATPTAREPRVVLAPASRDRRRLRCVAHDLGLGIMQVALAGKLDIGTARDAGRALDKSQRTADLVVLDLRELQFVGCTAVRLVLMADARARRFGGRLVILATRAAAPQLYALARLHRRLEIVEWFPGAEPVHAGLG